MRSRPRWACRATAPRVTGGLPVTKQSRLERLRRNLPALRLARPAWKPVDVERGRHVAVGCERQPVDELLLGLDHILACRQLLGEPIEQTGFGKGYDNLGRAFDRSTSEY